MNRLAGETSPYLRQHAENPVDWYPWGDDALTKARAENKPVLLSVGYSSCHWCHVMAHESFEDPDVAAVMNRLFVNVKVDREERPDVDGIYMQAVQAMTGRGGWPLTVFLTPDGRPFFGGTYFPKEDGHAMPGFVRVLEAVDEAWRTRRGDLLGQAGKLTNALERIGSLGTTGDGPVPSPEILAQAYASVRAQYDPQFGGFGPAPKFPQAMTLDFLLRTYVRNQAPETLDMVRTSVDAMAAGGMYDQVGGGFHRYSTDAYWLVPHFEKMLYDQALLTGAYLHAYLVTGETRHRRVVEDTIGYVLRDLRDKHGGFFSAEDADSEGVEGKFYLWSFDEIERVCGDDAADVVRYFGVTEGGNFEDPHTGYRGNILHVVDRSEKPPEAIRRVLPKLLAARDARVRPGLDDKVLLAWNALFLRALAEAAAALERDDWMDAARGNVRFLLTQLRREDGRLLRSWQDGRAHHLAYAEDYAALLEALVTLAEVDDIAWLRDARWVADELLRLFHDEAGGGFFTTGIDADALIVRPKEYQDNATPAENSLAANGLLRLAALTGDARHEEPAREILRRLGAVLAEHATAFAYLLGALERLVTPPLEVAIVGPPGADGANGIDALRREVFTRLLPASVAVVAAPGSGHDLTPLLAEREPIGGKATAYVCEHYACRQPVTTPEDLREEVDAALAARRRDDG
ncbi:MAG TPA: thioredoxin domain-containing protein [Acidimicrobiia bacterium]|nr:thioredoxin domain-containing protein [Acidimicrobiia bacterium]